jgi:hypothetical protein
MLLNKLNLSGLTLGCELLLLAAASHMCACVSVRERVCNLIFHHCVEVILMVKSDDIAC